MEQLKGQPAIITKDLSYRGKFMPAGTSVIIYTMVEDFKTIAIRLISDKDTVRLNRNSNVAALLGVDYEH
jgi:hypothetical protein